MGSRLDDPVFERGLGSDYYCETCGSTWNRIEISWDNHVGGFDALISVGCYGGSSAFGLSTRETVAFLMDGLDGFEDVQDQAIEWVYAQEKP
jgi:hypothetical protein